MPSRMIRNATLAAIASAMFSATLCSANETSAARSHKSNGVSSERVSAGVSHQEVPDGGVGLRIPLRLIYGGLAMIGAWIGLAYKRMDDRRMVRQMSQGNPDSDAERDLQQEISRRFKTTETVNPY